MPEPREFPERPERRRDKEHSEKNPTERMSFLQESSGRSKDMDEILPARSESKSERSIPEKNAAERISLMREASGDHSGANRLDWASGDAAGRLCSDREPLLDPLLTSIHERNTDAKNDIPVNVELERYNNSGLLGDIASTERCTPWQEIDMADAKGGYSRMETWRDFVAGTGDFIKNYISMKEANTIGGDVYFHCMANCDSAGRGPGGIDAALVISYGREAVDLPKNMLIKGMSWKDSVADAARDLEANRVGREGAKSGIRCNTACERFRPRGL